MGIRKGLVLAAAAALGGAVVILPAAASSETAPTVTAENVTPYHYWTPNAETISEGSAIVISNPTSVPHGVRWYSVPETPECTKSVPVGTTFEASGKEWSGTCTFKKAGTYVFWCTVHGEAMKETVTVKPATTTTGTTTGTSPGGTTGTYPGGGGGGGTSGSPPVSPLASPPNSPVASAAVTAVKIRSRQRGRAVRGSFVVSSAGAGGRLEVDLLAKRASLASVRSPFMRVGRIVRSEVGSGTFTFKVPVSTSGRRALARAGRLVLVVRITLTPHAGAPTVVKRTVSLHA